MYNILNYDCRLHNSFYNYYRPRGLHCYFCPRNSYSKFTNLKINTKSKYKNNADKYCVGTAILQ